MLLSLYSIEIISFLLFIFLSESFFAGGLSLGSGQLGNLLNSSSSTTTPKKYLTHTACFSKLHTVQQVHEFLAQRIRIPNEEMRLWNFRDEVRNRRERHKPCKGQTLSSYSFHRLLYVWRESRMVKS